MSAKKDDAPSINENSNPSLITDALENLTVPRLQYLLLASFFRFSAGLIIAVWAAQYYKQVFLDNTAEYAVVNAVIKGALGMTSGIVGGYLAGNLSSWMSNCMTVSTSNVLSIMDHYFDGKIDTTLAAHRQFSPRNTNVAFSNPTMARFELIRIGNVLASGRVSCCRMLVWTHHSCATIIGEIVCQGYCARDFYFGWSHWKHFTRIIRMDVWESAFRNAFGRSFEFQCVWRVFDQFHCFIASDGKEARKHTPVEAI
ncbi:hypothetical protein ACHAWX_000759 [Stephanocyclus meneghinianus]